jgi:hypothetical protein
MKKGALKFAIMVWYTYLFVTMLAVPVFNWRYAREHGFVSWLCLGEVVATLEAAIWPYYAITEWKNYGNPENELDAHFVNSRRASHQALMIIDNQGGILNLDDSARKEVIQLLESAAAEAALVQDSFLQEIHVEFPHNWKEGYTTALTELVAGIETGDEKRQIAAVAKYNSFSDWVQGHASELRILR